MITISRILCPTDLSELSRRALDEAVALARWFEAEVTVLQVAPVGSAMGIELGYIPAPPALSPEARERLRRGLRAFVEPARDADVIVRLALAEGNPAAEIVAHARQSDLVVMGTHGRRGLDRWLGGSVTEAVLRQAPCPVLTVAQGAPTVPTARFATILCPVDFSTASEQTAHEAALLAWESEARLVLMHVIERPAGPPSPVPPGFDRAAYRADAEANVRRRLRRLRPAGDDEAVAEAVAWGWPAGEILREARARHADLIVMGAHGGPLDSPLLGSTTHKVVRRARCPVLVVRARAAALPEGPPEPVGVGHED